MTPEQAFAILGLPSSATIEEVKKAFKVRSRMMHPDRFAGRPEVEIEIATEDFKRLNSAYEVLISHVKNTSPSGSRAKPKTDYGSYSSNTKTGSSSSQRIKVRVPSRIAINGGVVKVDVGYGQATRSVKIRIPAGVEHGEVLRVPHPAGDGDLILDLIVPNRTPSMSFDEFVRRRNAEDWSW